jgi:phosphoribosylaminoimidazole carboxylase
MLNILGGATPSAHLKLAELARATFDDDMDVYLHLYNKESKPGRKIGHITLTGTSTIQELEAKAKPFIDLVDEIRRERISASAETLRPKQETAVTPVPVPAPTQQPQPPSSSSSSSSSSGSPLVLVTMGSDSDLPVLQAGLDVLRAFGVPYALDITSAHRTARYMMRVAEEAAGRGIRVIIAAAGGAAHLPGMLASETPLPVVGVPVKATHLDGLDSLLSIVQMPVSNLLPFIFPFLSFFLSLFLSSRDCLRCKIVGGFSVADSGVAKNRGACRPPRWASTTPPMPRCWPCESWGRSCPSTRRR